MTDFANLLGALSDGDVAFIIIGGVAATIHGSARLTQDVDVCYSRTETNLSRLVEALRPLTPYLRGAPAGLPFEWSVATLRAGLNFTLSTTAGAIDLFGEVAGGGTYEDLTEHTITVELFGRQAGCLDLEWLIRTKRAAGRARDLEAIAELEILRDESAQ
ncbi:MAG: hypothetical protein ACT4P6_19515 [Gemmatimonadaceae bacterium]